MQDNPSRKARPDRSASITGPDDGDATVRIDLTAPSPAPSPSGEADLYTQYAIQEKIGGGGMGVVFLARDRKLGRYVAIKRLNRNSRKNGTLRQRFLHEARAVASLNHVHIVHIYALGEDSDGPYIVMEYVPGPDSSTTDAARVPGRPTPALTLDRRVSKQGQLSVGDAVSLLIKIADAVAFAHANDVIHRDLKPGNILLDRSFEPKIVDFGLARHQSEDESRLTAPGEKMLTLGYGAPEQEADASTTDERADVYGLGALLYFTITGQNPRYFREQDIPSPLRDVLAKALATDRERRWASAAEFATALRAFQSHAETVQPTAKTTWRCKWCDTVNPLSLRYCAECGWEGSEPCPECGASSFVGIQYCGACGADARVYEAVTLVLHRMEKSLALRQYERVLSFVGRTLGFEPAGDAGRAMLRRLQQIREEAERGLARREQLKTQIPEELRMENFERAQSLIEEFRIHSEHGRGFETDMERIPAARLRRDAGRAQAAMRNRHWDEALRIGRDLLRAPGIAPAKGRQLLRRIRHAHRIARLKNGVRLSLLTALLYVLGAVPALKFMENHPSYAWRAWLFRPAMRGYALPFVWAPLREYARLWDADPAVLSAQARTARGRHPAPDTPRVPDRDAAAVLQEQFDQLHVLRAAFEHNLAEIDATFDEQLATGPGHYLEKIHELMESFQSAGDFESWEAVHRERERFENQPTLDPPLPDDAPDDLVTLRRNVREIIAAHAKTHARQRIRAADDYLQTLQQWLTQLTKAGRMDAATAVNNEIRAVRNRPEITAARQALEALETLERGPTNAPPRVAEP